MLNRPEIPLFRDRVAVAGPNSAAFIGPVSGLEGENLI
ncbi:hypothetical protein OHAE_2354 [Ochrobactrum soli]|uniref:Uncharacterized protein n=1 Tax=Ochrobactrum soli TaxID=2448455 RepID=A0A2P9HQT1_9HYPH|nr:hypothetical protein OHAE_2354 [[Ochrobactrum] soli]